MSLSRWLVLPIAAAALAPSHLPILHDQYPQARARAIARHLPLFVEVWAPW